MTARRTPKTARSYDPRHRRDVGAPVRVIGGGTERTRLTSRERRRLLREAVWAWMEGVG